MRERSRRPPAVNLLSLRQGELSRNRDVTQREVEPPKTMTRMTWPDVCRSNQFKGLWVAIDNCRYDQFTRQPVEGDVVDSDRELSELCARMRETGRSACAILF